MSEELKPCPLPYDVVCNGVTFSKGVDLSTFVTAARRWHKMAQDAWNTRADAWRPIEGAPRDGTEILCWSPGFAMGHMVLSFYDGYWREKANGMGLKTPPTDWQPLPQPPATPSAEQSDADKV